MANDKWGIAILTVSDRVSSGICVDSSGPVVDAMMREYFKEKVAFVENNAVPDDMNDIRNQIISWTDRENNPPSLILTTGGTGFAKRDVTPEAVTPLFDKNAQNLVHAAIYHSLSITKFAALSRATAGVRLNTLIITLPGSPKACREILSFLLPLLGHALELISSENDTNSIIHPTEAVLSAHACNCDHSTPSIERTRVSPYPMISLDDARRIIMAQIYDPPSQRVPLSASIIGAVLAEDIHALIPSPAFRASVVDVPICAGDVKSVVQTVNAGSHITQIGFRNDQVVRVSTGAPVPDCADAVVMVEDTEIAVKDDSTGQEKAVKFLTNSANQIFIRGIGSDIKKGEVVVHRGTVLNGAEVAALASSGIDCVCVQKRPVVAIFSTGNELQDCFEKDVPLGFIRDANRVILTSYLTQYGFNFIDLGIAKDNLDDTLVKMRESIDIADVVITTGGVSMGEMDIIKSILKDNINATIHFGRVNVKPGKPCTFATVGENATKKFIFGLPGNPVSAAVCFLVFCLPALRKLSGLSENTHTLCAIVGDDLIADQDRPEFHRVKLSWQHDNNLPIALSTGQQHSSRLLSLSGVDGLVLVQPAQTLRKGDTVRVLLLNK